MVDFERLVAIEEKAMAHLEEMTACLEVMKAFQ
jgi:hypothetical protein